MDAQVIDVVRDCTKASDEERIAFPELVRRLMAAGVERYHADLQRAERTYYLSNGESHVEPSAIPPLPVATVFSPAALDAAVRAAQAQAIQYREFCRRIMAAGCVGYVVSLAGRRAVYCGRTGDSHVEPFPPAR